MIDRYFVYMDERLAETQKALHLHSLLRRWVRVPRALSYLAVLIRVADNRVLT